MRTSKSNRKFTPKTKVEIVLEHSFLLQKRANPRFKTVGQLCQHYGIQRSHLQAWNQLFKQRAALIYMHGSSFLKKSNAAQIIERHENYIARLEEEIERLRGELGFEVGPAAEDRITRTPRMAP